jgi:AmpD protein
MPRMTVKNSSFQIDAQGWLQPAVHCPSPNFNQRPVDAPIDLLVIHNISLPAGEFGGDAVVQLFCNTLECTAHPSFEDLTDLRVSAHVLIDRLGCVTQFVSLLDRAWHAGVSRFGERDNCNDFSIGIELEGTDTHPYTLEQYQALVAVTRAIVAKFPAITQKQIVGHCDIAAGRKTDPGESFDWELYFSLLAAG